MAYELIADQHRRMACMRETGSNVTATLAWNSTMEILP
jgi:hypothetical protein